MRQNFALAKKKIDGLRNGAEEWTKIKIMKLNIKIIIKIIREIRERTIKQLQLIRGQLWSKIE